MKTTLNEQHRQYEGTIVDVISRRAFRGRVTVQNGRIAAVDVTGPVAEGRVSTADVSRLGGPFLMPGLVDAHVHVESSMLPPSEFARVVFSKGTVAVVTDPHEIANVLGVPGIDFMMQDASACPLKFGFCAPSCVPATSFDSSGAVLGPVEVESILSRQGVVALGEVMDFPAVLRRDDGIMRKIASAVGLRKKIDGHAPGLSGKALSSYFSAGITTDHECTTLDEALEKIGAGMKVQIREGSAVRNLDELMPLLSSHAGDCMFCTDDAHPDDLLSGHIESIVRRCLAAGHGLFDVLWTACISPVLHYGLPVGLLRPGDPADFIVVDHLEDFEVSSVFIDGNPVFQSGECQVRRNATGTPNIFDARIPTASDFRVSAKGETVRVIDVMEGQLLTGSSRLAAMAREGGVHADPERDLLKIAVIDRYGGGHPAVGFIRGFGLKAGALATSVSHDSHNILVVGADDASMARAAAMVIGARGGMSAAGPGKEVLLPLPIAGIMSDLAATETAALYLRAGRLAREMGSSLQAPFMTLSFMALLVIPSLKIGHKGLFDSEKFEFTPLFC